MNQDQRSETPRNEPPATKGVSRRRLLQSWALLLAGAPLVGLKRVWAFPGYLGFFKKKNSVAAPTPTNTLFTWADNSWGNLGYAYSNSVVKQIGTATNWTSLSGTTPYGDYNYEAFYDHYHDYFRYNGDADFYRTYSAHVAIRGGQLWAWGMNYSGNVGVSDQTFRSSPVQVGALTTWSKAAISPGVSSQCYVMAITTSNTLWTWGDNYSGQLGSGTVASRSSPVQVGALSNWSKVFPGYNHCLAIKTDGTLWAWGSGSYGTLGNGLNGATASRSSPIQVGALTTWSTAAASNSSYAIKTDGTLWTWGLNNFGSLGSGTTALRSSPVQVGALTNWSKIAAGEYHAVAIKTDGTLWSWGNNPYGQLGVGHTNSLSSPVQVGALTTWTEVVAGKNWTLARKTDNTIWFFGVHIAGTYMGGTGIPGSTMFSSPVQVGSGTNWASLQAGIPGGVTSDSKAWVWGSSPKTASIPCSWPELTPTQLGLTGEWQSVSSFRHTLAVKSNGTLWSWGMNLGMLAQPDYATHRFSPVQVGSGTNWSKAFTAYTNSAALKTDGTLWVWGDNTFGTMGPSGPAYSGSSPVQVGGAEWSKVQLAYRSICAIKTNGTLWAWGGYEGFMYEDYADYDGDGDGSDPFWSVDFYACSSPVQIGAATWKQVAGTGTLHYAIKSDDTLWYWGRVGSYDYSDIWIPASSLTQVGALAWSYVSAHNHTLAIRSDGSLWAWGLNNYGELGLGHINYTNSPVQVGTDTTWTQVRCGDGYSFGLKSNGTLWVWGDIATGQAGTTNTVPTYVSSPIQVGTATDWTQVPASVMAGIVALK